MAVINGTFGDDILTGNPGEDDTLNGRTGNDTYIINPGDGNTIIGEYSGIENSTIGDTVVFGEGISPEDVTFVREGFDLIVTIGTTGETVTVPHHFETRYFDDFDRGRLYQVEAFEFNDGTRIDMNNIVYDNSVVTEGDDVISLNNSGESLETFAGDDHIIGGKGNDYIDGGDDNDVIYGEGGDDIIVTGHGNDTVYGGSGDDLIFITSKEDDHDTVIGGAGSDTYFYGLGSGDVTIEESRFYLSDHNKLIFDEGIDPRDIVGSTDGNDILFTIKSTGAVITIKGELSLYRPFNLIDSIEFQDGTVWERDAIRSIVSYGATESDDDIVAGNYPLLGLGGNDILNGHDGYNVIHGGEGNDTINGHGGVDYLYGENGNDRLNGGDGGDYLSGGDGRDYLSGGDGSDNLDGGDGNDSLYGDDGDDDLSGGDGNDSLYGGDGNDNLDGGAGHDYLYGGTGNDTLSGGVGNDYMIGVAGDDSLSGEDGNDTLLGGTGDDVLFGGAGNDYLNGSVGNDVLLGGGDADALSGGEGDDSLSGGQGGDYINGGHGSDTYYYGLGHGNDTIYEAREITENSSVKATDVLHFAANIGASDISLSRGAASFDLLVTIESSGEVITVREFFLSTTTDGGYRGRRSQIEAIEFNDGTSWDLATIMSHVHNPEGTAADDVITLDDSGSFSEGFDGNDDILGGRGNDIIDGGNGDDTIFGEQGNDFIIAGNGSDVINGGGGDDMIILESDGNGSDIVSGGLGNDLIAYAHGSDDVTIQHEGLLNGTDTLFFDENISVDDVTVAQGDDGDILLNIDSTGGVITIESFDTYQASDSLAVSQVSFVDGTSWYTSDLLAMAEENAASAAVNTQVDQLVSAMAAFDASSGAGAVNIQDESNNNQVILAEVS